MAEPLVPVIVAPPGALLAPVATDLPGAAARVGHDVWWAARLFEVLGAWATDEPDPDARVLFGRQCAHVAWRAEQWHDRLPELREAPRDAAVASPGPAAERLVAGLRGAEGAVARLVGVHRVVLPRLVVAHQAQLAAPAGPADGPVRRTLRLLLPDEQADRDEGEALLQARLVDDAAVTAAADAQAGFERLLVG